MSLNSRFLAAMLPALFIPLVPASATIIFQTGNQQYTNVNIAADVDAPSVVGDIGNTGVQMAFNTMIGPDGVTQVTMHGQHGVAFVQSFDDSQPRVSDTGFSSIHLTPQTGFGFTAGDFSLDQLNSLSSPGGIVTFIGTDQFGNQTETSLSISQNGQNQYNFLTQGGELVTDILISVPTTDLLESIRQVSVEVAPISVPEPSSLLILTTAAGLLGLGARRRRRAPGNGPLGI